MLLRYAIIPVVFITLGGLLIFAGVWRYSIEKTNRSENSRVSSDIAATVTAYADLINGLENNRNILEGTLETDERVEIFQGIYDAANKLDRKANLYVFDSGLLPVISATVSVPEYLDGEIYKNWGIFRIMSQNPGQTALKLLDVDDSGDMQLLVGKAIVRDGEIKGYAVFVINSQQFQIAVGQMDSQTIITDDYGWVFVSNNYTFLNQMGKIAFDGSRQSGEVEKNQNRYYISSSAVLDGQIHIYSISPLENQILMLQNIFLILLFVFVMLIIAVFLGAKGIAVKKTKDLDSIIRGLEKVKEGDLNTHIDISSNDEFQTIGESYNLMIDSLREQIRRNAEMGGLVAESQRKQLESQFNPHFMFNTLENIRFMCKLDPDSASKMVLNLSTLLRYSVSNTQEEVTVKEDLVYTENYLSLLKYRFNQRFHYAVNIPPEVQECVIPKLIIQPMIENAIKYGFEGKDQLLVEVNGYMEDGRLILMCSDDGAGMKPELLDEIRQTLGEDTNRSSHSGLYNVHRRVLLMYGTGYGIRIESTLGRGTCLRIVLPVKYKEGTDDRSC